MAYPGGKNGSGVPQAIINQIQPHDEFVELFLGSGAVSRLKRPAAASIGIDADPAVIAQFPRDAVPGMRLLNTDALGWLKANGQQRTAKTMMYLDPPYLKKVRKSQGRIYKYEFWTEQEHGDLLETLLPLNCMVAISGYYSELYAELLKDWRVVTFTGVTRGGPATEHLWMNYDEPFELHDDRYLGNTYRERQDFKRQKQRWLKNLAAMKPTKRYAIMAAINELKAAANGGNADVAGRR